MTTRNVQTRYYVFTPQQTQRRPLSPRAQLFIECVVTFLAVFCIGLMTILFT